MRATGMPDWIVSIVVAQAARTSGKGRSPPTIASGMPVEPQRDLGDDAERALRADEQPRQVVAGRGLLAPGCRCA